MKPLTEVKQLDIKDKGYEVKLDLEDLEGTELTLKKHQELYDRFGKHYIPWVSGEELNRDLTELFEYSFRFDTQEQVDSFNEWKDTLTSEDVIYRRYGGDDGDFNDDDTWDYPGSPYLTEEMDIY